MREVDELRQPGGEPCPDATAEDGGQRLADEDAWPGTDAHRYTRCGSCGTAVRDFHGDAVWRDREGYMTCGHEPPVPGSTYHAPCAAPSTERTNDA